jgi:ABC-type Fe3+/spermidine/putrescine transport system ATPase subunit
VTHDQQEALTMSDHIAVMSDGWVEQIGTPEEIYHRPVTPFGAGFSGEASLLPGPLEGRDAGLATVTVAGGEISVLDAPASGSNVLVMIRPERVQVGRHAPAEGHGGIPATVQDVIFRGATVHVGLTTADGAPLVADLGDDRSLDGLRPGDPAWATWVRDDAYLVPRNAGHSAPTPDPLDELDA